MDTARMKASRKQEIKQRHEARRQARLQEQEQDNPSLPCDPYWSHETRNKVRSAVPWAAPLLLWLNPVSYLKITLWVLLFAFFVENEFGTVYILASLFYLVFTNFGRRRRGELSGYSVFNPNFEAIDGTLTAEQLEKELRREMY